MYGSSIVYVLNSLLVPTYSGLNTTSVKGANAEYSPSLYLYLKENLGNIFSNIGFLPVFSEVFILNDGAILGFLRITVTCSSLIKPLSSPSTYSLEC
mgnify:CR=1 FL=1